jgi:purine nucleosidase
MGACVVDWWGTTGKPANAHWVTDVNANKMFHEMAESISHLP